MKKLYAAVILSLVFFSASAQTIVVSATQDNTIYSDFPGNSNGAGENFTAGSVGAPGSVRRALIRFDISAVPAGATITSATLNLNVNRVGTVSGPAAVSLHLLGAAWGEGSSDAGAGADGVGVGATTSDATWLCSFAIAGGGCVTPWTLPGADFLSTASATTTVNNVGTYGWSSAQMVADIQGWVNAPTTNFGWIIIGEEVALKMAKRFDSRTSANVAARPSLSITYSAVAPVTLRYFKAQPQRYGTLLQWETDQEFNNDYFDIEYSRDGGRFTSIGQVKGSGNSSTRRSYQFIHQAREGGRHFYRLVQVDVNKSKHYSDIASVQLEQPVADLLIAPNPVSDVINLPGYNSIDSKYQIIDITGQQITQGTVTSQRIALPPGMPPGMYQLIVSTPEGKVSRSRFQKQ